MVNVKTASDIPKAKIFECASALKNVVVTAPVKIGDVVLSNVAGTGVDVVAAKNIVDKVNRSLGDVVSQILWCFYRL